MLCSGRLADVIVLARQLFTSTFSWHSTHTQPILLLFSECQCPSLVDYALLTGAETTYCYIPRDSVE